MLDTANEILTQIILWMTWSIFAMIQVVGFFYIALWLIDRLSVQLGLSKLMLQIGAKIIKDKRKNKNIKGG